MKPFTPLICDLCNGSLVMDDSREFAICEYCGTKYMASTLRAKVMEIKGTVKVEGAVETTFGNAEKERLLYNAETNIKLNDYDKANQIFHNVIDQYPDDYRGHFGVFKTQILGFFNNNNKYSYKDFSYSLTYLEKALMLCSDNNDIITFFTSIVDSCSVNLHLQTYRNTNIKHCVTADLVYVNYSTVDEFTAWLIKDRNLILRLINSEKLAKSLNNISFMYHNMVSNKMIAPYCFNDFGQDIHGNIIPVYMNLKQIMELLTKCLSRYRFIVKVKDFSAVPNQKDIKVYIEKKVSKTNTLFLTVTKCRVLEGNWLVLYCDDGYKDIAVISF